MIQLSKQEAIGLKQNILSKVTASRIPGSITGDLFNIYKTYVNSTRYREAPCTCSAQEWKHILQSVVSVIDDAIARDTPQSASELPGHVEAMLEDTNIPDAVQEDMELQDASQMPTQKRTYKRKPKA